MLKFCPLFSSSSGNSVYVGDNDGGILIDVGRSAKQIREKLEEFGVDESRVKAIFLTHEHEDHIKGLNVFLKRNDIPVYAGAGTLIYLKKKGILPDSAKDFTIDNEAVEVAGMTVEAFKTSHDCADGRGFTVTGCDKKTKVSVATDTGVITDEILTKISGSKLLYIESNHDVEMLLNGDYFYPLKQRILSDKGHLSNEACCEVLKTLVNKGTTHFILAHLSRDNNTPLLAEETAVNALREVGAMKNRDYILDVAEPVSTIKPILVG